jgi:HEPN domain-containing protein
MNETVREWIAKADGDYATARRELAADRLPNHDAVCFHCQQCLEKLMKAVPMLHQTKPPRTHDLVALSERLHTVVPMWTAEEKELRLLNQGAVLCRYPGESASPEKAAMAFSVCERLRAELKKLLESA